MNQESKKKLLDLINSLSVRKGTFKMSSGKTSNLLIDLSTTLRTEEGQSLLSDCASDLLPKGIKAGGPISGSDLVCSALARKEICSEWFGVRKEPKGRGLDKKV